MNTTPSLTSASGHRIHYLHTPGEVAAGSALLMALFVQIARLAHLLMADPADPVEIGHIVRSHDPCLVCTVHFVGSGERHRYGV